MPTWDTGIAGSAFTHYATMPTPIGLFLKSSLPKDSCILTTQEEWKEDYTWDRFRNFVKMGLFCLFSYRVSKGCISRLQAFHVVRNESA